MARAIRVATNIGRIAIDELPSEDQPPQPGEPPPQTAEVQQQANLSEEQDDTPGEWYLLVKSFPKEGREEIEGLWEEIGLK